MDLQQENLFSILQIGDRQIQNLKKNVCMIVGLTRNGKTCFFNHLLGRHMIGVQDPQDPQRIIYEHHGIHSEYALMGSTAVSVTLAPNIADLSSSSSLIDMIGFQQNRNEKSVLTISYFLSSCFEKADKVKFMVVVSSETLGCINLDFICGSFNELIEMFALSKFGPNLKQSFLDSIAVVVTSAKQNADYYRTRLQTIMKQLSNPNLQNIRNRELIVQLLKRVVDTGRVQCFAQARQNHPNQKCNSLNKLNLLGWEDFDLKKAKQSLKDEVVIIPFKQDLNKLNPKALSNLKKQFQGKIQNLYKIGSLFEIYLEDLRCNWAEGRFKQLNLSQIKAAMNNCVKQGFNYCKDALYQRKIAIPINKSLNIFQIVRRSLDIYDLQAQFESYWNSMQTNNFASFEQSMNYLNNVLCKILDCLIPAFTQQADLRMLTQIRFILTRGVKQLTKFNQLDPMLDPSLLNLTFIFTGMKDRIGFLLAKKDNLTLFTLKLDKSILRSHFKNFEDLEQYEKLLEVYRQISEKGRPNEWLQIKVNRMKVAVKQLAIQIYKQIDEKPNILKAQAEVIQLLLKEYDLMKSQKLQWASLNKVEDALSDYLRRNNKFEKNRKEAGIVSNKEQRIEEVYYHVVRAVSSFLNNLIAQSSEKVARIMHQILLLCDLSRSPKIADSMYQKMFKEQTTTSKKIMILQSHIILCKKSGWLQKASMLLHTKRQYHLQELDYPKLREVKKQITNLQSAQNKGQKENVEVLYNDAEIRSLYSILQTVRQEIPQLKLSK